MFGGRGSNLPPPFVDVSYAFPKEKKYLLKLNFLNEIFVPNFLCESIFYQHIGLNRVMLH